MSALVPPTSKDSSRSRPASRLSQAAPAIPPAGPDSTVVSGASPASSTVIAPPPERMTWKLPAKPPSRKAPSISPKYYASTGRMNASRTVVEVRSYSRYSRATSIDSDTATPGTAAAMTSPAWRSCSGLA